MEKAQGWCAMGRTLYIDRRSHPFSTLMSLFFNPDPASSRELLIRNCCGRFNECLGDLHTHTWKTERVVRRLNIDAVRLINHAREIINIWARAAAVIKVTLDTRARCFGNYHRRASPVKLMSYVGGGGAHSLIGPWSVKKMVRCMQNCAVRAKRVRERLLLACVCVSSHIPSTLVHASLKSRTPFVLCYFSACRLNSFTASTAHSGVACN